LGQRAIACCSIILAATAALPAAQLIGITNEDRQLRVINPSTGESQPFLDTGISGKVSGVGSDPSGNLYVLTTLDPNLASGMQNSLLQIDANSGTPMLLASFQEFCDQGLDCAAQIFEGGLTFDAATGLLYGLQQVGSESSLRQLFTIDLLTAETTLIGAIADTGDFSALAFSGQGTLFVLETTNDTLLEINPFDAQTLRSVGLSIPIGETAGMAVDPLSGEIYVADGGAGSTDGVYVLDPETGELTLLGPGGVLNGYSGLTYLVPEPSAALYLTGIALLAVARRRRRTSRS
jgi:DNA-binding beta-propeller fold protein YncE